MTVTRSRKSMRHTIQGARSMVRSVTRRIANDAAEGDAWELPELVELMALRDEADAALAEGVAALRRHGYSWAEVGAELGCSRQAAQQRFSR